MTRPAGDALELALALFRVPAQRLALRQRPLPADIGRLLPIAAGSPEPLAEAARSTGETEAQVLEAVRFYLQEMLFFPEADAYRVLGLAADAPAEQIRQHHRWLQRWLHPDRRGDDWESIFATRINQAWSELRHDQRRHAYDVSLQERPWPKPDRVALSSPAGIDWRQVQQGGPARGRLVLPVTALVAACLWLAVLLARQTDDVSFEDWQSAVREEGTAGPATRPFAAQHPQSTATATRESAARQRRNTPDPHPRLLAPGRQDIGIAAAAGRIGGAKPPASAVSDTQEPRDDRDAALRALAAALERRTAAIAAGNARSEATSTPVSAPHVSIPIKAIAVADARVLRSRQAETPAASPAVSAAALASRTGGQRRPTPRSTTRRPPDSAPASMASAALPATIRTTTSSQRIAADIPNSLEQVRLARLRAGEVTAFLSDPAAPVPPVWNDVIVQEHAERLRHNLYAVGGRGRLVLDRPDWRISHDRAQLAAAYRRAGWRGGGAPGVLHMQMGWRDSMWLVEQLDLEQTP